MYSGNVLSVNELLLQGGRRWPDSVWVRTPEGEASRGEMVEAGRRVAGALRARGIGSGSHVVLVAPNGLPFLRTWFGIAFAGAIAVPMNPKAAPTELGRVVATLHPDLIVSHDRSLVSEECPTVHLDDLADGPAADPAEVDPSQPVTYIQTSGSTGQPKFVIETHGMYSMAAEGFPYWLGLTEQDVVFTALPLSHINAQAYSTLGSFACGAELALLPRFSASTFWSDAVRYGATQFNAIGAIVEALMRRDPDPIEREHRVRLAYSAPAPTEERHREIEDRFGFRLVIGYALSESPYGMITPSVGPRVFESIGRPRQHPRLGEVNQVRIVGPSGAEVPTGEVGEIVLRNPAVTPGYFGQPEESARILEDGWLHTGDLGRRDADGTYYFAGRSKDIIRHKGENLTAAEVEAVVNAHPGVAESAVIGVPSDMTEEDVKAFVMVRRGLSVTAEELGAWCAERLPRYKRPRYVELVEDWPVTETQKIAKPRLPRERTAAEVDLDAVAPRPA